MTHYTLHAQPTHDIRNSYTSWSPRRQTSRSLIFHRSVGLLRRTVSNRRQRQRRVQDFNGYQHLASKRLRLILKSKDASKGIVTASFRRVTLFYTQEWPYIAVLCSRTGERSEKAGALKTSEFSPSGRRDPSCCFILFLLW